MSGINKKDLLESVKNTSAETLQDHPKAVGALFTMFLLFQKGAEITAAGSGGSSYPGP